MVFSMKRKACEATQATCIAEYSLVSKMARLAYTCTHQECARHFVKAELI